MSETKKYTIEDASFDLIEIVDNLLSIVKKQNLSTEDFNAAKMEFNKFCSIRKKLNGDSNIPLHTNDN